MCGRSTCTEAREVAPGATWAQYSTTGHVVLAQNGHLSARQFDARSLETRGSPFPLADSIAGTYFPIRLSRSGVLVARTGTTVSSAQNDMVWVTRAGAIVAVDTAWRFRHTVSGNNHGWALSHDGTRLAIGLSTDAGDDVWIKELPHGPSSRLTYDADDDYRPRWSKDGRVISFVSNRGSGGVYARRSDFTGSDSLLRTGIVDEALIAPDESSVLIRVGAAGSVRGGRSVFRARIGDSTRVPLIVTEFDEDAIALSPDANWLAYQSDETGRKEVFVRSYPDVDGFKRQISNGGGEAPLWSRDGRELFYVSASRDMISVRVAANASSTGLITSAPERLFRVPDELLAVEYAFYTPWDVASDGRFIMARRLRSGAKATARTVVAEHWLQELVAKTKR
jgi:eukaryotic-like serine/threonine-protein kinase